MIEIPSIPTSYWPSRTAWIIVSQEQMFQTIFAFSLFPISLTASYSHPMAFPVLGSTKFSGVNAFSVTARMVLPFRSGMAFVWAKAALAMKKAVRAMTIFLMTFPLVSKR